MSSLGDFDVSTVIYDKFTLYRPTTGAPYTLAGTPAVSVYKDNSTTQSTAGVTLTVDFDGVTGLNHITIDTSADGTFYSAGSFFNVIITTGTVDSVSAVGTPVSNFTLRKTSALKPATAGRTLVVDAAGLADANMVKAGPSGSGTAQTAGDIIGDTNDIQARLPAALVSGRIDASVGAMAANVITAAATATDFTTEVTAGLSTLDAAGVRTAVGLASANLDTQLGAIAGYIDTEVTDIRNRLPAALVGGRMDSNVSAIGNDTTALTGFKRGVLSNVVCTCDAGSSTTSIVTSACTPAGAVVDQFKGRVLIFDKDTTTTALRGQATDISASSNAAAPTLTVTALTTAPVSGDTFVIV